MNDTPAVSSPEGTAGEKSDALSRAFDAAVESVKPEGADFQPAAMAEADEPKPKDTKTTETKPESTPSAKPDGKQPAKDGEKPTAAPSPASDALAAPAHWDAARKEKFGKLPPEGRQLLLEMSKGMENDFARTKQEYTNDRKFAQGVRSILTDEHRAQMRAGGMRNEIEGIAHLIKLSDMASKDFPGYVRWAVLDQAKADPRQIFPEYFTGGDQPKPANGQQQQPQPARHEPSPIHPQVHDALRTVIGRLDSIEQGNHQTVLRSADKAIERFKTATDEAGALRRPHFDRVYDAMVELLPTPAYAAIEDFSDRMQKAYDAAVWMDPTIRTELVDSDVNRRLAEKMKADDLAKARVAKAPIKGQPAGPVSAKPKSLEENIRNAMNLHGV